MKDALKSKFWKIVTKFYDWDTRFNPTMNVPEMSHKFKIRLTDGFFYKDVLPKLLKERVLLESGYSPGFSGRRAMEYTLDKESLDEFFVKNNLLANRLYKKWVLEWDVNIELLED